ncbi:MAG TPA: hypothetical protein VH134_01735 [Candidatus Dormibacteraeota bacterium]|nr:hypothetical protein [Candidatus Dormibacteraeota bacterium]
MRRRGPATWLTAALVVVGLPLGSLLLQNAGPAQADTKKTPAPSCQLGSDGKVKHVIDVIFDNTHFTRDNPNVPSDLEQMPNLLNFLTSNGTLLSQEHTPLISHTATNILSHLTGLYGDSMGQPVSNGFGFYDTNSFASFRSSFAYWTATLGGAHDNTFNMLTKQGKNTPAPWVPWTRAGCNVGGVATANQVLENTHFDIPLVFGTTGPEFSQEEAAFTLPCGFGGHPACTPAQQKQKNAVSADFVGIGVHCAKGSTLCAAPGAVGDVLPDEPGGYNGYKALIGARYVNPQISGTQDGLVRDLAGNVVADGSGNPGFPGFDSMTAANSLGYVADMQEHGVPVTYAYLSDLHDNHATGLAQGPGEAAYVAQLRADDQAFGAFFSRLAADGINRSNTIFEFSSDEGDHFAGGPPAPLNCDGVTVPCTYAKIGEVSGNVSGMLSQVAPYTTGTPVPAMGVHSDSAPTIYLNGNPSQTDPVTRTMEQGLKHIQAVNPITGETDHVTNALAGVAEMNALHMITGDPARNPTVTLFANPDYFLCATGFQCPFTGSQTVENPAFAWNHGDNAPEINTTWLGLVGPGVRRAGVDTTTWADHTDDRPTELALAGLRDDYTHDGRVLVEVMNLPQHDENVTAYEQLARAYKQLDASVGSFGETTLRASTVALESGNSTNDSTYTTFTQALTTLTAQRDALAAQIEHLLDGIAGPGKGKVDKNSANSLSTQALQLIQAAGELGGGA